MGSMAPYEVIAGPRAEIVTSVQHVTSNSRQELDESWSHQVLLPSGSRRWWAECVNRVTQQTVNHNGISRTATSRSQQQVRTKSGFTTPAQNHLKCSSCIGGGNCPLQLFYRPLQFLMGCCWFWIKSSLRLMRLLVLWEETSKMYMVHWT
jgi:hypothetical protein